MGQVDQVSTKFEFVYIHISLISGLKFPDYVYLMAVGKGFLDQYSVFCVFGSVVGCVVVPLITQVCRFAIVFLS